MPPPPRVPTIASVRVQIGRGKKTRFTIRITSAAAGDKFNGTSLQLPVKDKDNPGLEFAATIAKVKDKVLLIEVTSPGHIKDVGGDTGTLQVLTNSPSTSTDLPVDYVDD